MQTKINKENKTEQKQDEFEVVAWINKMNIYDKETKKYTDEINPNTLVVKTHDEKPEIIGYIQISTLESFLDGEKRSVPIKRPKRN